MIFVRTFFLIAAAISLGVVSAHSEPETFRTPAKVYGSAYSIKMTVSRNGFTYDIPVWVKPDQKTSSLDHDQIADLGWIYKNLKAEEVLFSEESVEVPDFINQKAEWAYVPDFAKSCCYGVIGQDILKKYDVRFDPNPPAHLEWTNLNEEDKNLKANAKFTSELKALFSIRSTTATISGKKIDLSKTPYRLKLASQEITFEPEWINPKGATHPLKSPIFQYEFIPPKREVRVISISTAYLKSAHAVKFKPYLKIEEVNHVKVGSLDRFELEDYLKGKRSKILLIATEEATYTFDFEKNEFIETTPIQSNPGRN
jgi:hypothetical protein